MRSRLCPFITSEFCHKILHSGIALWEFEGYSADTGLEAANRVGQEQFPTEQSVTSTISVVRNLADNIGHWRSPATVEVSKSRRAEPFFIHLSIEMGWRSVHKGVS